MIDWESYSRLTTRHCYDDKQSYGILPTYAYSIVNNKITSTDQHNQPEDQGADQPEEQKNTFVLSRCLQSAEKESNSCHKLKYRYEFFSSLILVGCEVKIIN